MGKSSTATFIQTLGGLWSAIVLITLIESAFMPGPKAFIASLTLVPYLALLYVALLPGIIMLVVSERMT